VKAARLANEPGRVVLIQFSGRGAAMCMPMAAPQRTLADE
jgi:hypothetical protein